MPELPEPLLPPFKLGEPVEMGSLDGEGLLVITVEMVLLPLTVIMVVVIIGADSTDGAAVVVSKAVWLRIRVDDSGVDVVGTSLDGVGIRLITVSSVVDGILDGGNTTVKDKGSDVVAAGKDRDSDAGDDGNDGGADGDVDGSTDEGADVDVESVSVSDSTAELVGETEGELPVPPVVIWLWRLCR